MPKYKLQIHCPIELPDRTALCLRVSNLDGSSTACNINDATTGGKCADRTPGKMQLCSCAIEKPLVGTSSKAILLSAASSHRSLFISKSSCFLLPASFSALKKN